MTNEDFKRLERLFNVSIFNYTKLYGIYKCIFYIRKEDKTTQYIIVQEEETIEQVLTRKIKE